jgi:methylated-DNA-[protein]-cysteine S-methyltransferase
MPKPLPPEALFIDWVGSPIGAMLIVHDPEGRVRALDFQGYEPRMRHLLRLHYGRDRIDLAVKNRPVPTTIRAMLAAYFAGDFAVIDAVPVMTAGTSFQRQVWAALRKIRPGTTLGYGALASNWDIRSQARAVGLANGANPIAIVVPCHRVIGADAGLTGYGGGIDRKKWLLTHEGAAFKDTAARRFPQAT